MKIIVSGNYLFITGSIKDVRSYLSSLAARGGSLEDYIRECLQ